MEYSYVGRGFGAMFNPLACYALTFFFLVFVLMVMRLSYQILILVCRTREEKITLEITPSALQNRAPIATTQLFYVIHGIARHRIVKNLAFFKYSPALSLEIVSTKKHGIRFLIHVSKDSEGLVRQLVQTYMNNAKIETVSDYPKENMHSLVRVFRQTNHFAHSLSTPMTLSKHDPAAYLTGAMTKLGKNELMSFQVVITPAHIKEAARISNRIRQGHWSGSSIEKRVSVKRVMGALWNVALIPFKVAWILVYAILTSSRLPYSGAKQAISHITQAEQELVSSMYSKTSQDLFYADIRSLVVASTKKRRRELSQGLSNSLAAYTNQVWQSLIPSTAFIPRLQHKFRVYSFFKRTPSLSRVNTCILSPLELGMLFHFPSSQSDKADNTIQSLSKTLPAPVSLKNDTPLDVMIGENHHHGTTTPIGLTSQERERHMYVVGGTRNGKTTMLLYGIVQDIKNGKGVAVIDPHGDLAETILGFIPEERVKDVIYLHPDDLTYPIGINLLELPEGLSEDDLLREKDLITESVVSVFRKVFSTDDSGGHRIEYILRNCVQTALTLDSPTLFTVFRLINDPGYRSSVTKNLENEDLQNFWKHEFNKAGDFQRVKMAAGITAKIGRFLFSAPARRMLEQERSTIDFDDIIDSGKVLICNMSKGLLGEDTSALIGTTVLAKLQLASLRRARMKQSVRRPFYLYVDEFQNFATMSFVQMLSESRKYKLYLTMAEQSTAQQEEKRLTEVLLANVGTVICFRSGSPADERLVLPLFAPYVQPGEIANLPSFHFYARLSAVHSQEPLSGVTVVLDEAANESTAATIIEHSRKTHGRKVVKSFKQAPQKKPTTSSRAVATVTN